MKTPGMMAGALLLCLLCQPAAVAQDAADGQDAPANDQQWVVYQGTAGPGVGKHIVFISGDEEYRSEEALPQLAKIAAVHHGFKCTVLFPVNRETGEIDPTTVDNIPGTQALDTADLMVIATRFRDLPDDQMEPIDRYLKRGGPVVGMRTATHAFNVRKHPRWKHYSNGFNGKPSEWRGGFGRLVLGEMWISHHGGHKNESTRGVIAPDAADHPIARGLKDVDIWGPSDVYGIRLNNLPSGFQPIVLGHVIKRAGPRMKDDPLFGMRPTDTEVNEAKSNPAMPVAWVRPYQVPGGKPGRAFATTLGAATDLLSEGVRRLIVNGMYWAMAMEDQIPPEGTKVDLVGEFKPTAYGFNTFKRGMRPSDFAMEPTQASAAVPRRDAPELRVLDRFIGKWDEEVDLGGGETARATGEVAWALGGTHVKSEFQVGSGDDGLRHLALITWDPITKTYVTWMFSSGAGPVVFTGTWDAEKQTFTQKSLPNAEGLTTHSVTKFVDANRIDWTVAMRDADGQLQMRLSGVDRRIRDSQPGDH